MKITYTENPLRTVVELDDHDKQVLRLKIIIDQQNWAIAGADFHLNESDEYFNIAKARKELKCDYWDTDKANTRIDMLFQDAVDNLLDIHCGNCTCVAMSCSKCHAEHLVGVDTMPGLGKHEANLIGSYFGWKPEDPKLSINEVIFKLEEYCQKPIIWNDSKQGGYPSEYWNKEVYDRHIPRWTQERQNALEWLKSYRDQHFPG